MFLKNNFQTLERYRFFSTYFVKKSITDDKQGLAVKSPVSFTAHTVHIDTEGHYKELVRNANVQGAQVREG